MFKSVYKSGNSVIGSGSLDKFEHAIVEDVSISNEGISDQVLTNATISIATFFYLSL